MTLEFSIDRWASNTRSASIILCLAWLLGSASVEAVPTAQPLAHRDVRIAPSSGRLHENLRKPGVVSGTKTQSEDAELSLRLVIRYQTPTSNPTSGCIDVHARPGSRVVDCTVALLSLDPEDSNRAILYAQRALAYYAANAWQMALLDFNTAIGLDPNLPLALNGRCWILASRTLDLTQAREDCDQAIAVDPTFHEAFDSRAMIAMREAKWGTAWTDFNTAVRLRGSVATYIYGRGLASLALGDSEAGERDLLAARALRPEVTFEYRELGFDPTLPPFQSGTSAPYPK